GDAAHRLLAAWPPLAAHLADRSLAQLAAYLKADRAKLAVCTGYCPPPPGTSAPTSFFDRFVGSGLADEMGTGLVGERGGSGGRRLNGPCAGPARSAMRLLRPIICGRC